MQIDAVYIMEIIGTIVFAFSGALVAIEKRLDLFGIFVLSVCTAVGGGMCRDVILGNTPPAMFRNSSYTAVAAVTCLLVFIGYNFIRPKLTEGRRRTIVLRHITYILDAIGLGIFTVVGINVCHTFYSEENAFLSVFVGVITGCGGGLLRDIMANRTPVILKRDIYASASLAGGLLYQFTYPYFPGRTFAMIFYALVIMAIRLCAIWRNWNLPSVQRMRYKLRQEQEQKKTESE